MIRGELFIGGEWQTAASGERFAVLAPASGEPLGEAAAADAGDVDRAVRAAGRAAARWAGCAPAEREAALLRAAEIIDVSGEARMLDLLIDESGSTIGKARFEIAYTRDLLRTAAGEARRLYGDTFPNDDPARMSMVFREPLGVVAAISPFNAPLALLAKMVAFPLAAGNAVVAKPSEETPLIALAFARVLAEAGLPAGVFNVVTGDGERCGRPLVEHDGVDGIAFTGSTATGLAIGATAVRRMCRAQLELGGNNPLLVLGDVDPERAAEIAARGAFTHGGQICMASARLIVDRSIAGRFERALVAAAASLSLGELRDPSTAYGPLINRASLAKVELHVRDAVARGARVVCGGTARGGLVYPPTVLADVPRSAAVWREETFGPVAVIEVVDGLDEAIEAANDSIYGLSAGVLTGDLHSGLVAARRIRAGAVHVGMHSFQTNALAPVGGVGASGIGRSGGKYSTEQFTELKWVSAELDPTRIPRPGV